MKGGKSETAWIVLTSAFVQQNAVKFLDGVSSSVRAQIKLEEYIAGNSHYWTKHCASLQLMTPGSSIDLHGKLEPGPSVQGVVLEPATPSKKEKCAENYFTSCDPHHDIYTFSY